MQTIAAQCEQAYQASRVLASLSTEVKNKALTLMSQAVLAHQDAILSANAQDVAAAQAQNFSAALIDRLTLTPKRLSDIAASIQVIEALPDPVGEILGGSTRPNGLRITKIRVPLGVVGIIYEARPNVTADAVALCVKTGNAVVLRGSSTTYRSNLAIATVLKEAAAQAGFPKDAIQLLEDVSREGVKEFVKLKQFLSVIIPRGGADLIQNVVSTSFVPTIETGVGNCHIFVDKAANLDQAIPLILNAKVQRPSVCNSCETVLIHRDIAVLFLPQLCASLEKNGVEIRGCAETCQLYPGAKPAIQQDWEVEFLDLIIAVKIVADVQEAIAHIHTYGTKHSEAILSQNLQAVTQFQQQVDAAAVLVNASTRFVDGGEFGFGAEMGISTQKLHARGPMGLPELTTYKYLVLGDGHTRG